MKFPRLSRRQQAALAVALAFLMWAPSGISHGDHTIVTGHSTFYNGNAYDPCLASIAGILRSRVMWFNDQVLVEYYGGKGTFIWVTEAGAPDPRFEIQLFSDGVFYDFVDPNGAAWHVQELYYEVSGGADVQANVDWDMDGTANVAPSVNLSNSSVDRVGLGKDRYMLWVVELAPRPIYDQFAGKDPANAHTYYNFVTLVDTCKMHRIPDQTQGPNATHTDPAILNKNFGHENGADPHEHETWFVDIYVGKRPIFALAGASPDGVQWQSDWAYTETSETAEYRQSNVEGYLP